MKKYYWRRPNYVVPKVLKDIAFGVAYVVFIIALWCIGLIAIMGTYAVYSKLFS